MAGLLVLYATTHGQTQRIVERLGRALTSAGREVTFWRADRLPAQIRLDDFDAVLIAGSVFYGRHQRDLRRFVAEHAAELGAIPSAFVSVCGALAGSWSEGPREAQAYVDRFLAETGWRPTLTRSFAGAIRYTRYGWLTRWIMKRISRRTGRPTDTSRDWEFTDWAAVDRFATEIAALGAGGRAERTVASR